MYEDVIELKGDAPGPTSIILAGVHGNETCGVRAFEGLLPGLSIERGRVLFAYGNPRAIERGVRQTEANLNRMFKPDGLLSPEEWGSYEYGRAQFLRPYLEQADALLDIHSSFVPDCRPFLIAEGNASAIIEQLPFDLIVSGFDEIQPGGTDYFMNSMGRIGICAECGYLGEEAATRKATSAILAFLRARAHLIQGPSMRAEQSRIRMYGLRFSESDALTLSRPYRDFEEVQEGEVIGIDGGTLITAGRDSVILFARECAAQGEEAFLLGERV